LKWKLKGDAGNSELIRLKWEELSKMLSLFFFYFIFLGCSRATCPFLPQRVLKHTRIEGEFAFSMHFTSR
jgi:hypothetical protein